ncbi:hypothetical protein Ddye_019528 [Dipteronia dyeriana]|uniref:Gnk2-homologous domain-containing protein n=1 Tax=Dipteronia dyeriana TaxID=168575 RepID=A0AAD9TYZ4_9ROSI|nr:hypothetical protein Ddye_019528 [Dipteronia dyeriana]
MMYSLIDSAPNTDLMFGTKENDGPLPGIVMLQCTRDINGSSCRSCFDTLTKNMKRCCQKQRGWRLLSSSCFIRYEEFQFNQQPPAPPPPHVPAAPQPTPIDERKGGNYKTTKIVIITLSSFVAVTTAALLGFCYYSSSCRKKEQKGEHKEIWNEDKGQELIDLNIVDNCPITEVLRWIHIALLCVQDDPTDRPTMSLIVLMLASQAINLPQPSTPPYSVGRFTTIFSDLSSIPTTGTETGFLTSYAQTSSTISSK